jgi:sortase (surface protein transpeptidase)
MLLTTMVAAMVLFGSPSIALEIPSIGVDTTSIVATGFVESGRYAGQMEVPASHSEVAWFKYSSWLGEGHTVLAAHVAFKGERGVFWDLVHVNVGDVVMVNSHKYEVEIVAQYGKDVFPAEDVFIGDGTSRLVLITCGGAVSEGSFVDNIVVYARPVP